MEISSFSMSEGSSSGSVLKGTLTCCQAVESVTFLEERVVPWWMRTCTAVWVAAPTRIHSLMPS